MHYACCRFLCTYLSKGIIDFYMLITYLTSANRIISRSIETKLIASAIVKSTRVPAWFAPGTHGAHSHYIHDLFRYHLPVVGQKIDPLHRSLTPVRPVQMVAQQTQPETMGQLVAQHNPTIASIEFARLKTRSNHQCKNRIYMNLRECGNVRK